jgi:tetratricopeptide (TPR) repeat protein
MRTHPGKAPMRFETRAWRSLRPPLIAAAIATLLSAGALPALAIEAEIINIVGKGEARESSQANWRPAVIKQKLPGGAFVRTGDLSQMALLMQDQTQLRLNQNSMLQIKEVAGSGAPTRLDLRAGRAWMQSKGQAANVVVDTPNATAAIRGTDWEMEVDPAGKTMLAVFSGTVEFSNPQGSVTVGKNEGALAEFGKAPVKILLTNPRDRIQWVNALSIDPRQYAEAAKSSPAVKAALDAIAKGDLQQARAALAAERARGTRVVEVYALLADIELVSGQFEFAMAFTNEALAFAPRNPELLAQRVREQLLADRVDDAKQTLALPRDAETAGILVASGETARREGLAPQALAEFARATRAAPADDRGWFALGRAQGEREDVTPARQNLSAALKINPAGAGYQGELATLETFANRFEEADRAFNAALEANAGDYVAYTGLGLLRLKQGNAEAALDAFLKAGVLEPRYARAKTFTAVAYYQLGRHADAVAALRQAAEADDKDPLPYLYLTQIYTDLFRAGDAVEASREALKRLPYLKSLNQVANNQQGTGNLGYSLAFFGLEEWAVELAQQSYSPYLANSHLFLADRYRGQYNKNSELFQGFLTDPIAFGGSNRFSSLVPTASGYATLGEDYSADDGRLANPFLRLNGIADGPFGRGAYFIDAEKGVGTTKTTSTDLDGRSVETKGDRRAELYALGLGTLVTENLGLFGYGTKFRDTVILRDLDSTIGATDKERADVGARYRFSPTSMTWIKFGRTKDDTYFDRYFIFNQDLTVGAAAKSNFSSRPSDIELRHSIDLAPTDHLSLGVESARDRRTSAFYQVSAVFTDTGTISFGQALAQEAVLKSKQAYASYIKDVAPQFSLQGDLFWQQFDQRIDQDLLTLLQVGSVSTPTSQHFGGGDRKTDWNSRVGFVFKPDRLSVRAAWQRWMQPASTSTLSPVATAGIPLDDRLVAAGGKATRSVVQFHGEPDARTQLSAFYDDEKVRNLGQLGFRIPVPQIQFVELLRNAQIINVATADLLEGTPDFDEGRLKSAGVAFNRMLSNEFSLAAWYVNSRNRATIYVKDESGNIVSSGGSARIPFIPRDLAALGITWVSPQRIYFSAQAVYRSERFTDRDNTPAAKLRADTTGAAAVFWETPDKRLILGAGAVNLGSRAQKEIYTVDLRYRY